MKKTAMRVLSVCLTLSMCLGMMLMSAQAVGVKKTVTTEAGDSYTLTAEKEAVGEKLTVAAAGLPEGGVWTFYIHVSRGGTDRYSLVGPDGQFPFVSLDQAFQYLDQARMDTQRQRSFVLTIPWEYQDWNTAIRIVNHAGSAVEIPLKLDSSAGTQSEAASFSDVAQSDWFQPFVVKIVDSGWMSGVSRDRFDPNSSMTVVQVLVMAAKLHSDAYGREPPKAGGGEWYAPFYNYCVDEGLIAKNDFSSADMNRPATRFEMVELLDKAAHKNRTSGSINEVADGFIPDLAESEAHGAVVYRWYRAGLVTGGSDHSFNGRDPITRAEAAAILCRLTGLEERSQLDAHLFQQKEQDTTQERLNEVVRLVNKEREKEGLSPLQTSEKAVKAAAVRAQELVKLYDHQRPDGDTCFTALKDEGIRYSVAGENIARGYATPADVVKAWMSSPGHRANIMNDQFTTVGVGYAEGGSWVQVFVG